MSLIDNFSKPRWQHHDPEIRMEAIDQLDDQAMLFELADTDPDLSVRAYALSRITSSKELDELIDRLPQALQKQARSQRLQQLLPDPAQLSSINDDDLLVRIAGLTDDPEIIITSIGQLRSSAVRVEIAGNHPLAKVRLCAAKGIEEIELLQQLSTQSRHKDKAVYLYCKERLEQHNSAERERAERESKIQELLENSAQLSHSVDSPEYKGRYLSLNRHWQALIEHANPEQQEQIQKALDICAERIANLSEALAATEELQLQIAEAQQTYPALLAELEELDHSISQPDEVPATEELNAQLNGIEERWVAALRHAPASSEQTNACKKHLQEWRAIAQISQLLIDRQAGLERNRQETEKLDRSDFLQLRRQQERTEKLISKFQWPASHNALKPLAIRQLEERLAGLKEHLSELSKNEKQHLEQLDSSLEKLRNELETNHFKNADRALNKVRHALRQVSPEKQQHYQHELRPMIARLHEIHDWQGFAIEPKKIELCQRMKALIDCGESADVLATKIKALQDEWKKLGPLSPRRDQTLWNEFKVASDEAFKPCKEAFAERAVLCQQNFGQRMALIAQLREYEEKMAWPDAAETEEETHAPDWKLVQKTLDTAREAFRNIKPVDRKGERRSQKALKKVCDRIYGHIKQEYQRNITCKKDLVNRARALVELEDLNQAIDSAKRIQREWKEVGMTPVGVDRKLWKEFRASCDAVFARLDKQREQVKVEMSAQIEQAEALVQQARTLLDSGENDQRLHLKRNLRELQASLRRIELPRNIQQRLHKRFADMEREATTIVSNLRTQQEQEGWQRLLDKMKACAMKASDEKQAQKLWQNEGEIPKGIDASQLDAFWQQGSSDIAKELQQETCIALEILIGADSPPEDKQARMAYQMKRLIEGMGSHQLDSKQSLFNLINDFIAMRPTSEWLERFCRGVEIARTRE